MSIVGIEHHDQINVGRKGLFPLLREAKQEPKAGTWRQEQKEKPWRDSASWLAALTFLGLFSDPTQDHMPRVGTNPQ